MGRPTLLTPEIRDAIARAVSLGISFTAACELADVDHSTGSDWLARGEGRKEDRPALPEFVAFATAIRKAQAQDEARRVARIEQAGRGGAVVYERTYQKPDRVVRKQDGSMIEEKGERTTEVRYSEPQWTADMTHLERRYPKTWARRERMEVTGEGGGPVEFILGLRQAWERQQARLVGDGQAALDSHEASENEARAGGTDGAGENRPIVLGGNDGKGSGQGEENGSVI